MHKAIRADNVLLITALSNYQSDELANFKLDRVHFSRTHEARQTQHIIPRAKQRLLCAEKRIRCKGVLNFLAPFFACDANIVIFSELIGFAAEDIAVVEECLPGELFLCEKADVETAREAEKQLLGLRQTWTHKQ